LGRHDSPVIFSIKENHDGILSWGWKKGMLYYRPSLCLLFIDGDLDGPNFSFVEIDKYWSRT
jgi:hypothetical protein